MKRVCNGVLSVPPCVFYTQQTTANHLKNIAISLKKTIFYKLFDETS